MVKRSLGMPTGPLIPEEWHYPYEWHREEGELIFENKKLKVFLHILYQAPSWNICIHDTPIIHDTPTTSEKGDNFSLDSTGEMNLQNDLER